MQKLIFVMGVTATRWDCPPDMGHFGLLGDAG